MRYIDESFSIGDLDDYATELIEDLPHTVIVLDSSLTVLYHNRQAAEELLGNDSVFFIGQYLTLLVTSEALLTQLNEFIHSDNERAEATVSDGEKYYRFRARSMGKGKKCVILLLLEDISEQTEANNKLAEQERMYRQTFELASVGITHLSTDGTWLEVNEKFCDIVGYNRDELIGVNLGEITHPEDRENDKDIINSVILGEQLAYTLEKRYIHKDGHSVYVHITGTAVWNEQTGDIDYMIVIVKDISELRSIANQLEIVEEQMVEQEKLASLGQLAAGVAHEINNPIGFVNSNLGSLNEYFKHMTKYFELVNKLGLSPSFTPSAEALTIINELEKLNEEDSLDFLLEDTKELIKDCQDGMKRVQDIVQGLKVFARQDANEFTEVDIHQNIETTVKVIWNEIKYHCDLETDFGDVPPIQCVASKINQVIMNLIVNASHAIEEKGVIKVSTWAKNGNAYICVEDNGKGIEPEHLKRLFEPFFTTKEVGKGTGLGLSIAYGIIQDHNGNISVESTVGKGTKFTINLPLKQ